jgi:hypothetical protein
MGERDRRVRLIAGYVLTGLFGVVAVIAIVLALSSGSNSSNRGDPHIDVATGSTNGLPPDSRIGIEVPLPSPLEMEEAARHAGCNLRLRLKDEGHDHLSPGTPAPHYLTNPPTSGSHSEEQQADGAYLATPPPTSLVHSLEHGRLAIQYRPHLSEQAQLELRGLFDTMYGGALLYPNLAMAYEVAATTWTNMLVCPKYRGRVTLLAIEAFGRATWGRYGGEPVGAIPPLAPTPADPRRPNS